MFRVPANAGRLSLLPCEGLQAILPLERNGRRIIHDAVAGVQAAQRPAFAVTDLHEAAGAAACDMLRAGDRDPAAVHGAAATKTRSRCPSGSRATKVRPKSILVGGWTMVSPRLLHSACKA